MENECELKSLNGEQPEQPRIEPSAETSLTRRRPPSPPQEASESDESQTENVPPEKSWWGNWKWTMVPVAVVVIGSLFGLGVYCALPSDKPDNNTNNQHLVLKGLGEVAKLIDDRRNIGAQYVEPDVTPQGDVKDKEKNSTDSDHLAQLSNFYRYSLDQDEDPCYDFYRFVCKNPIRWYARENTSRFDTLAMLEKNVQRALLILLKKPLNTSDSPLLKRMKTFYKMCINTTKLEAEGTEPILALLKEIGGWPLLSNDWNGTESWEDIVASLNRAGWPILFPFHLFLNEGMSKGSGVVVTLAPMLTFREEGILEHYRRGRTLRYVKEVASLLNATNDRLDNDIDDCIKFESDLDNVTFSTPFELQKHKMSSLISDYPQIRWESLFRNLFGSNSTSVLNDTSIFLSHSDYTLKVSVLLNNTSVKIIRNYIVWLLMEQAIPMLPEKFRYAQATFELRPVSQYPPCLSLLLTRAEVSMGQLYFKDVFDGQVTNKSESMIKSIKNQIDRFFRNNTWTDSLMRKFRAFAYHTSTNDAFDTMEKLEFRSDDTTFANYRRLIGASWYFKSIELRMTKVKFRQIEISKYAAHTEAEYVASINSTYIPPAMFQLPFFSAHQPMYLNYGGMGVFIAREVTRQLQLPYTCDKKCAKYVDFPYMQECMVENYRLYVVKQIKRRLSPSKTVNEDIADYIGLNLAYRAYEAFARDSTEQLLPGFNYTGRQWFWINAATTLCRYETNESLEYSMTYDTQSPAEARVNRAFANIEEFTRDFACPRYSGMNTPLKCEFF